MVNSEDENDPPELEPENVQPHLVQMQYTQPAARLTAPPQWKASMSYDEWRVQVEMWDKLCAVRKIDPAEQGYALFNLVSQHSDHNVVSKLNSAVKNKDIDIDVKGVMIEENISQRDIQTMIKEEGTREVSEKITRLL